MDRKVKKFFTWAELDRMPSEYVKSEPWKYGTVQTWVWIVGSLEPFDGTQQYWLGSVKFHHNDGQVRDESDGLELTQVRKERVLDWKWVPWWESKSNS